MVRCDFDSLVQSDNTTHNCEGVAGVDFNFETLLVRDVNVQASAIGMANMACMSG